MGCKDTGSLRNRALALVLVVLLLAAAFIPSSKAHADVYFPLHVDSDGCCMRARPAEITFDQVQTQWNNGTLAQYLVNTHSLLIRQGSAGQPFEQWGYYSGLVTVDGSALGGISEGALPITTSITITIDPTGSNPFSLTIPVTVKANSVPDGGGGGGDGGGGSGGGGSDGSGDSGGSDSGDGSDGDEGDNTEGPTDTNQESTQSHTENLVGGPQDLSGGSGGFDGGEEGQEGNIVADFFKKTWEYFTYSTVTEVGFGGGFFLFLLFAIWITSDIIIIWRHEKKKKEWLCSQQSK